MCFLNEVHDLSNYIMTHYHVFMLYNFYSPLEGPRHYTNITLSVICIQKEMFNQIYVLLYEHDDILVMSL